MSHACPEVALLRKAGRVPVFPSLLFHSGILLAKGSEAKGARAAGLAPPTPGLMSGVPVPACWAADGTPCLGGTYPC